MMNDLNIAVLGRMREFTEDSAEQRALDAAIASLAPPSGEGVDALDGAPIDEVARGIENWATIVTDETSRLLLNRAAKGLRRLTTPQSDGDGDAVACKHEPYLGACVHCGVGFRNGVVVTSPPTTTAEAFATLRQALDNSVCYCGVDPLAIVTLRQDEVRRMLDAFTTPQSAPVDGDSSDLGEVRFPANGSVWGYGA